VLIRFLLYGLFGWCVEIVWTAAHAVVVALAAGRRPDPRLSGKTYLWMLPIYGGGILLFEVVHATIAGLPWPARGTIYMLGCFAVEYVTGWIIKVVSGTIPWDYSAVRWNVHGLIRLDYAPAWFCFGLLLERIEAIVRAVEPALRSA
jgi:uncharacterized membrane protein